MRKVALLSLILVCAMFTAHGQHVWTFDCNTEGWGPSAHTTVEWDNPGGEGQIIMTYVDPGEAANDPMLVSPGSLGMDLSVTPYIIMQLEVTGMPEAVPHGLFVFTPDGHRRGVINDYIVNGSHRVVIDTRELAWDPSDPVGEVINSFRFDIPDNVPYADHADAVVVVDYIAVVDDPDYVPVQDTEECPDPGEPDPAQEAIWRDYDAFYLPVAPVMDGVVTPEEYPTTPIVMTPANVAAFGSASTGNAQDPEDLSGVFYIGWDETYLYCAAVITDNIVVYNGEQGAGLNNTDGIQLVTDHQYLRSGDVGSTQGLLIHDLAPGQASDPNTAAYWQHWPTNDNVQVITDVANDIAGSTTATGYHVEMRLPWANFPDPITPDVGTMIGYAAIIMDFEDADLHDLVTNSADFPWAGDGAAGWNTAHLRATRVTVPDVLDGGDSNTSEAAEGVLTAAGLVVGQQLQDWSDTIPAGLVMGQSPAAGSFLAEGDAVDLIFSAGPMPDMPAGGTAALVIIMTGIAAIGAGKMVHRRMR